MLTEHRQSKLNPILDAIRSVDGIKSVTQDDFDSTGINVLITLKGSKYHLERRLQDTKRDLKRFGAILDYPAKSRSYNGLDFLGKPIYMDMGYDHLTIKLDVQV